MFGLVADAVLTRPSAGAVAEAGETALGELGPEMVRFNCFYHGSARSLIFTPGSADCTRGTRRNSMGTKRAWLEAFPKHRRPVGQNNPWNPNSS